MFRLLMASSIAQLLDPLDGLGSVSDGQCFQIGCLPLSGEYDQRDSVGHTVLAPYTRSKYSADKLAEGLWLDYTADRSRSVTGLVGSGSGPTLQKNPPTGTGGRE